MLGWELTRAGMQAMPWQMQQQHMQMQQQNGMMPVNRDQYGQQPPYMQHPGQMHMQASATHKHGRVHLPCHPVLGTSLMSFFPAQFPQTSDLAVHGISESVQQICMGMM